MLLLEVNVGFVISGDMARGVGIGKEEREISPGDRGGGGGGGVGGGCCCRCRCSCDGCCCCCCSRWAVAPGFVRYELSGVMVFLGRLVLLCDMNGLDDGLLTPRRSGSIAAAAAAAPLSAVDDVSVIIGCGRLFVDTDRVGSMPVETLSVLVVAGSADGITGTVRERISSVDCNSGSMAGSASFRLICNFISAALASACLRLNASSSKIDIGLVFLVALEFCLAGLLPLLVDLVAERSLLLLDLVDLGLPLP